VERIDTEGEPLGLVTYQDFDLVEIVKNSHCISQPGNLFRRTVVERVGLLDASLHFRMDRDYWLRAALVCQFGYLPRPLARFRRHEGAKTTCKPYLAARDVLAVYRKFFDRADLPAELVELRQRAWAGAHLYAATAWFCASDLPNARVQLWAALRRDAGMVLRTHSGEFCCAHCSPASLAAEIPASFSLPEPFGARRAQATTSPCARRREHAGISTQGRTV